MLNILLMIILFIIIIIFIILLFGVRLQLNWMKIDSEYDGCIKILILKKIKIYTFNFESDDDDESEDEEDEDKDYKKIFELMKPCFNNFKKFAHQLFDAITINGIENHLIIGFSNFATTGECIGYIWAILATINTTIPNTHLKAEPSFNGPVLNFKGKANIDISIIKLIIPTAKLLLNKDVRALINGVRNG